MFELSKQASEALVAILERAGAKPEEGLRIKKEDGNYILQLDRAGKDDRVIYIGDRVGLIIKQQMEVTVANLIIDFEEGSIGTGLTIKEL